MSRGKVGVWLCLEYDGVHTSVRVCELREKVRTNHPANAVEQVVWESGESFATVPFGVGKGFFFLVRPNQFTGVPLVTC